MKVRMLEDKRENWIFALSNMVGLRAALQDQPHEGTVDLLDWCERDETSDLSPFDPDAGLLLAG